MHASLAAALNATLQSKETRQHIEEMQVGVEAMVDEISQATKNAMASAEAQQVQSEVEKATQSAVSAGQETINAVRPQLLSAFRRVRAELDQIINRMEQESDPAEGSAAETSSAKDFE